MESSVPFLPPGLRKHTRTDTNLLLQSSDSEIASFGAKLNANKAYQESNFVTQEELDDFLENTRNVLAFLSAGGLAQPRLQQILDNLTVQNATNYNIEHVDFWDMNKDITLSKDWPIIADHGYRLLAAILKVSRKKKIWARVQAAAVAYDDWDAAEEMNRIAREPNFPAKLSKDFILSRNSQYVTAMRDLDNSFKLFPETKSDMILWRGITLGREWRHDDEHVVLERKWPAYSSLSIELGTSISYAKQSFWSVIFRVHVPAGTRLVPISAIVGFRDRDNLVELKGASFRPSVAEIWEKGNCNELLLPRNTHVWYDWSTLRWVSDKRRDRIIRVVDVYVQK